MRAISKPSQDFHPVPRNSHYGSRTYIPRLLVWHHDNHTVDQNTLDHTATRISLHRYVTTYRLELVKAHECWIKISVNKLNGLKIQYRKSQQDQDDTVSPSRMQDWLILTEPRGFGKIANRPKRKKVGEKTPQVTMGNLLSSDFLDRCNKS